MSTATHGSSREELHQILKQATDSSDAFQALFQWRKASEKTLSLGKLCRSLGVSSKGYLSDVASGRRKLALRYLDATIAALGLDGHAARFFRLLVQIDHETNDKTLARLREELDATAKAMDIREASLPLAMPTNTVLFEVFCAFGLFKGRASRRELAGYFSAYTVAEIEQALRVLESHRCIELRDEKYHLLCDEVRFLPTEDKSANIALIRDSIQRASASLDRYFGQPEVSFYESLVVSTRLGKLKQELKRIKSEIRQLSSDLEDGDADALVRINVQIHPVP